MAKKRSREHGINVEKAMIAYLWPDCPKDERGSVRDHKELYDKIIEGEDGSRWVFEFKGNAWPAGPASVLRILRDALEQCDRNHRLSGMGDVAGIVACYKPRGAMCKDSLCMAEIWDSGQYITRCPHILSGIDFKRVWLGRTDAEDPLNSPKIAS